MIRAQELAKNAYQESSQPDMDDFKKEDVIHGNDFSGDFEFDPP